MNQFFKVGKLAASFGLKGDLVLQHSLGKKTALNGLETIFLEEGKDNFMPYFITSTAIKNDTEVFLKLEGIDTKETARKLTPKEVWLTADDFNKFTSKSAPIQLLGFQLIDGKINLGEIIEVIEQPHQILVAVLIDEKEALIPIHQDSLEKIDQKNRKVYVTLPDGLLDIYK